MAAGTSGLGWGMRELGPGTLRKPGAIEKRESELGLGQERVLGASGNRGGRPGREHGTPWGGGRSSGPFCSRPTLGPTLSSVTPFLLYGWMLRPREGRDLFKE